jgi:hypothetical protein
VSCASPATAGACDESTEGVEGEPHDAMINGTASSNMDVATTSSLGVSSRPFVIAVR